MKYFIKIILFFFIVLLISSNATLIYAQSNVIQVDLGISGCNSDGICDLDETSDSCPVDCAIPPGGGGGGGGGMDIIDKIYIYDLFIEPDFNTALINWKSSVSTLSTLKWGKTTEVTEGTLSSIVFAKKHKVEIINLKPGTMYFFTIESRDVDEISSTYPPVYFFTKFLKDTAFPSNPRNVKTYSDISGITITWENPPDENFSYIRIMRHEDRFRGNPFLGKLIYEGSKEKFLDKDVREGKEYFYTLFARDTNGDFSSGVAVSEIAYSPEIIPPDILPPDIIPPDILPPDIIPSEEDLAEVIISGNFFVHQYGQLVKPLIKGKRVVIDNKKNTVIDTNVKTFYDDWVKVTNRDEEVIGQYLFSFNKDSGRYQTVIPPLQKTGFYDIEIYRYVDDNLVIINQGLLQSKENVILKIEKYYDDIYLKYYKYAIILFISLFLLFLLFFFSKRRRKTQQK